MISCLSAYGTGAAFAMRQIIDERSAFASSASGSDTMRLSWVGAENEFVTRCSFTSAIQRTGSNLRKHDDRRAERVRQRREGERSGVVQRTGREVHGVLVQQPQRVEQREDDLAIGACPQRALGLARRARRVDHRRAGFARRLDVGFGRRTGRRRRRPRRGIRSRPAPRRRTRRPRGASGVGRGPTRRAAPPPRR